MAVTVMAALQCFNAGELSPKMLGRNDISQYAKGCSKLENFLVTPYGSVERRPGTRFLAAAKTGKVRLIPFIFSSDVAYICEFGDRYIRFYQGSLPISTSEGVPYEIESPYSKEDLDGLRYIQSADIMTICHPSYPVQELRRVEEEVFELVEKVYEFPPMRDPNVDHEKTMQVSSLEGETVELTASFDAFREENVGGYFQLVHRITYHVISCDFVDNDVSRSMEVFGVWTLTSHGTWTGDLAIQRSVDGGTTFSDHRVFRSDKDTNVSVSGEETERGVLYRLEMRGYAESSSGTLKLCRCKFFNPGYYTIGVFKVNGFISESKVTVEVLQKPGLTEATSEWSEGAWSYRRGFPCSIAFFEERMIFGGTRDKPQTIWGSRNGDWDNFLTGALDDDALDLTLASDTVNEIHWMCQHDALIIGTSDSEWTLSASDTSSALTPTNFALKRQSVYGAAPMAAQMVGDTVLFVQQGGRKVREFVFQWEKNGYSSPDMTILADHISRPGIREVILIQQPDSILWCLLKDGTLAALTYERDQQVIGWHRHCTEGKVQSLAVIPDGDRKVMYWAVERMGQVCIEEMNGRDLQKGYMDSAVFVEKEDGGPDITQVSGLDHLEGQKVKVWADGDLLDDQVVENGKIELDRGAGEVWVGLPYTSTLSPMPVELELANGSSMLRKKAIGEIRVRFYDSIGGEVRCGKDEWQKIISRDIVQDPMDESIPPRDTVETLNILSDTDYTPTIEIRQKEPLPMNVNSLVVAYNVMER